ncbi:molecular chaperone TorD family protein [Adlercreutzia sp. R25]|uniref:Molecular chaperone TorD family protein n=1 Tax=Adlercreutzia shanghongiae TaxID=3111773 RepID=A0ABU6IZS4_9ACTN|nr:MULTISPECIES: molecular chaperone TorD family protein [unclassified Adlercreutzia]MEC4273160.1 molecular chaperone TorD family protein [Adlercreutzia sp. R25]MEC4295356.1 molecular chaperone TorD family protein [Adlercreutzia sp. R22]
MVNREAAIRRYIGLADCCELLSETFKYPTERLISSLLDGSYLEDCIHSVEDAGAEPSQLDSAIENIQALSSSSPNSLLDSARKGYSLLYLAPGSKVPVFPYESPFRFVADQREGVPSLFRSQITLDVERQMAAAGVLPCDRNKEPSDSIWREFSFLSFLLGSAAAALCAEDVASAGQWIERARTFWSSHAQRWVPDFMLRTAECARSEAFLPWAECYECFADVGSKIVSLLQGELEGKGSF